MKKFGRENNFKNMQKYFMIFMVLWSWFPNQVLKIQKMWGEGQRDAGHQHCGKNWIAPSDVYHTSRLKSWGAEGPTNFFWFFPLRAFISGTMVNLIGAHKKETTKNNVESSWGLKTFGLRLVSVWWIVGIPRRNTCNGKVTSFPCPQSCPTLTTSLLIMASQPRWRYTPINQ